MPRNHQTAAQTLAQKAIAAGITGVQVDGNDVIAVRQVCVDALERARRDGRPTLIEALTYRMGDHTTADDARRYRSDEAVSPHWKEDPISRLRTFLTETQDWSHDDEEKLIGDCRADIEKATESYLAIAPEPSQAMFDSLYKALPESLEKQRSIASSEGDRNG